MPSANRQDSAVRAQPYRATRWPVVAVAIAACALLTAGLVVAWHTTQQPAYAVLPAPSLSWQATEGAPVTATSTAASAGTSTSGSSPTSTTAEPPETFAPSRAVQIYLPNADPELAISTDIHPLGGCRSVIDPPRNGPDFTGVFGCTDFAQPGTASPSLAVLAGHSSQTFDTVFNKLYVQGAALEGQTVYLRTEDSGDRWLAYRIEHTYTPDKNDLPYLTAVWGGDGSSTSGRLVLVTCQQTDGAATSTANYVAVAQYVGVV